MKGFRFLGVGGNRSAQRKPTKASIYGLSDPVGYQLCMQGKVLFYIKMTCLILLQDFNFLLFCLMVSD